MIADGFSNYLEQLHKQRRLLSAFRESDVVNWEFFKSLLLRNRGYIVWVIALLGLQLAEIYLLASVHFIYFPPESLWFLKILSTLTLLGIVTSLKFKSFCINDRLSTERDSRIDQRALLLLIARSLLIVLGLFVLVAGFYLLFATRLHFTAPAIYRAVLAAALLSLPFDVLNTLFLYNLKSAAHRVRGYDLRTITLILNLIALGAIIADFPLMFIFLKLASRIWLFRHLAAAATADSLISFFRVRAFLKPDSFRVLLRFWAEAAPTVFILLLLELAFILIARPLGHQDPNLAALLFYVHKIIHIGAVLGLKANLTLLTDLIHARILKDRQLFSLIIRKTVASMLFFLPLIVLLFSLLLVSREIIFWNSPLGEELQLTPQLIGIIFLTLFVRILATTFAVQSASGRAAVPALIIFILYSLYWAYHLPAGSSNDAVLLFMKTFALDNALLLLIVISLLIISSLLFRTTASKAADLLSLLNQWQAGKFAGIALLTYPSEGSPGCIQRQLLPNSLGTIILRWGPRCHFIFFKSIPDLKHLQDKLIYSHAYLFDRVIFEQYHQNIPVAITLKNLLGTEKLTDALYNLARGNNILQEQAGTDPPEKLIVTERVLKLPDGSWDYYQLTDKDRIRRVLLRLNRPEGFSPWLYSLPIFKGLVLKQAQGELVEIIIIRDPQTLKFINRLRFNAFCADFSAIMPNPDSPELLTGAAV